MDLHVYSLPLSFHRALRFWSNSGPTGGGSQPSYRIIIIIYIAIQTYLYIYGSTCVFPSTLFSQAAEILVKLWAFRGGQPSHITITLFI